MQRYWQRALTWVDVHPWSVTAILFVGTFVLAQWITAGGTFPDPDSFYHARIAMELLAHGPVRVFPYLSQTVLADAYVDHHFLYHVLLVPFFFLVHDAAHAMLLSASVFAAACVAGLYRIAHAMGYGRAALLLPLLLLSQEPFLFRVLLAKAPAVSVLCFAGVLLALHRSAPRALAACVALYVLLYNGWIVGVIAVVVSIVADVLTAHQPGTPTPERGWHWRDRLFGRRTTSLLGATALGVIGGHLVHPNFPANISFAWLHIVRIGMIGFRDQIGVGGEWYPYQLPALFQDTGMLWVFVLLAMVTTGLTWFLRRSRVTREQWRTHTMLWLLTCFFLWSTLRSRRNVEYFEPVICLTITSSLALALQSSLHEFFRDIGFSKILRRMLMGALVGIVFITSASAYFAWRTTHTEYTHGFSPTIFSGASAWLDAHTSEGSVVFHSDWSDPLFFLLHSTHNRYLVALDPVFFYVRNPAQFFLWRSITRGEQQKDLLAAIASFDAHAIFVSSNHHAMQKLFSEDKRFVAAYHDGEGTIFVPQRYVSSTP